MSKRAEEKQRDKIKSKLKKDLIDTFMGQTIIYDDEGNRVKLCDVPPAYRIEYIEYKDFTFEEYKKAFEKIIFKI